MPDISLTDFVDFVIKSGTPKLTKIRAIKNRPDYEPALDFWKQLREGIQRFHRAGAGDKTQLDDIVNSLQNPRKSSRYFAAVSGYKKFLGRRNIRWFTPPTGDWSYGDLSVKVNPELGLRIEGDRHLVKLYFKDEAPTKNRLEIVSEMMKLALSAKTPQGTKMAVLDVSKAKLYTQTVTIPQLAVLLEGEAAAFLRMWESV
jgi:hypothetical protein